MRTPLTVAAGPLGSGKTTLLRHILERASYKLAILMNEFGEIAIDSRIIEGKSVRMAELAGGCVCCSLIGEFEAAVTEILDSVDPDWILVETTGVAEPNALIFDIQESLPRVRLDGVVTLADADAMLKFPRLGHTTRLQIEAADLLLLNKTDLVPPNELPAIEERLRQLTPQAALVRTVRAQVDLDLLFGMARERYVARPQHRHQPEFESFDCVLAGSLEERCFREWADALAGMVYRAKGFVRFPQGTSLFNFVAGRWELEPFPADRAALVFIGTHARQHKEKILEGLRACER